MNIAILTSGLGGKLSVLQIHHQAGLERVAGSRIINLLILDARHMEPACFTAACAEIGVIKAKFGLHHSLLLCQTPTLPITVAAIRCGLRDIISQYLSAAHLRAIIQASHPGVRLGVKEFDSIAVALRALSGLSSSESPVADLARREQELARRTAELNQNEARIAADKESIDARDRDLRERTRRFDRQLARLQTDADVAEPASQTPWASSAEYQVLVRRLEQRAAELDVKEKLLNEMQALLLAAPPEA